MKFAAELTPKEFRRLSSQRARDAAKARVKAAQPGPRIQHKAQPVKANRGRERDPGFLAFLRRLPCVACLVEGGNCGPTEAAHLRFSDARWSRVNPGLSVKPSDKWATPLGAGHHRADQHMRAERAFWERLGIEPGALASDLFTAYHAGSDGSAIVAKYAAKSTRKEK